MANKKPLTRKQKLSKVLIILVNLEKGNCDSIDALTMITQTLNI